MHRWLVAVFALHFFLSVGAFAFGQVTGVAPSQAHAAVQGVVADASTTLKTAPDPTPASAYSTDHALTDTQADLPECLDVPVGASSAGNPLRTPSPPLAKDLTPPVLDGPQRPPRGLPTFA
jgi:ABC-type transporter MlaC component